MLTTCHRFELDLDREIADQLEPFDGGHAAMHEGTPASCCVLLSRGGVGRSRP